jgi:hypothetical protein
MADDMTKGELLGTIARSYASWQEVVQRVPRERMTESGFAGEWSLKDVVAHLTVYERWTADNLEADARGERVPEVVPWGPLDGNTADMDVRNAAYYRYYRDTPLDEVLEAAQAHHHRLVEAIESVADGDFNQPQKFAWTGGQPVWEAIAGNSFEHYDDHQAGVRTWLEARGM